MKNNYLSTFILIISWYAKTDLNIDHKYRIVLYIDLGLYSLIIHRTSIKAKRQFICSLKIGYDSKWNNFKTCIDYPYNITERLYYMVLNGIHLKHIH